MGMLEEKSLPDLINCSLGIIAEDTETDNVFLEFDQFVVRNSKINPNAANKKLQACFIF